MNSSGSKRSDRPQFRAKGQKILDLFHPVVAEWFQATFKEPTAAQQQSWPAIASGRSTLLLAPTGSGKTLAAFLVALNRILFEPRGEPAGVRVVYVSPLKALGVDVERNLQRPLAGIRETADQRGVEYHIPRIAVRSGDSSSAERRNIAKQPPDILITTPESLYLMLTSKSRDVLRAVETVIVDEIHSVAATKRGTHLFLSLERLESLRGDRSPIQRIGLSATQRPLDEIARLLGGAEASADPDERPQPRPVEIVEAGRRKQLELTIEVPVEEMANLVETPERRRNTPEPANRTEPASGTKSRFPDIPSIWPAIHPRLVELIRSHRSTMIFVNSRRLAERLAGAINDLAEEELALAHHGSLARDARLMIEERLKSGLLPAIVATSSLELGIDMGLVDLVIQIEAPPSIASGLQRIGRAGHQVGTPSTGIVFPKFRGDLLACAAAAERMKNGDVEETFYPRNPLDVLAQQIVAIVAGGPVLANDVFTLARCAASFAELPRKSFDGVLDLLSGRYPSSEFSELYPRLNWDRQTGELSPRKGTQRIAVLNAGTIPDRGLFGVFLAGDDEQPGSRVGELDEEMVFEMRTGDVFLLGASSWRVLDITQDRVIVAPAPGEPGRMPFWRGDNPGRPFEFGLAIGSLSRRLLKMTESAALERLEASHGLDVRAARNLLAYLTDQQQATGDVPSDQTIVVECFLDEVGDWRVAILSPFGARVHAPWATAVRARLQHASSGEIDVVWTDDGIAFRLPEADGPPSSELLFPQPDEIEDQLVRELPQTALFAARFRENAARALLLPRRTPGRRMPLWLQRRRAADLLKAAVKYESFPILLETFRECLRDVFDLPGLRRLLGGVAERSIRVRSVQTDGPSPFASALLFSYSGNFIYDGDVPLAERKAAVLALDHAALRELLGDADLRELLDPEVVEQLRAELQRVDGRFPAQDADAVHDLLRQLGDLTCDELAVRSGETVGERLRELLDGGRAIAVMIAGESRFIATEDAARYRDALGVELPSGLPEAFLETVADPLADLVARFAQTRVPFRLDELATRFGLGPAVARQTLQRLAEQDRVLEGEFLPGGHGREWCDSGLLRTLKRRSLARLRKQVEPVEPDAFARFLLDWQGISQRRRGLDALLDVVEQLQGLPLPVSILERDILPARIEAYRPGDLDELCAAGEVVWQGCGALGANDGRIALFLTDAFGTLSRRGAFEVPNPTPEAATEATTATVTEATKPSVSELPFDQQLADRIRDLLASRGASFFESLHAAIGGFRNDLLNVLWSMVWAGELTNDSLRPLRSLLQISNTDGTRRDRSISKRASGGRSDNRFRSRRSVQLPGSEGRWTLLPGAESDAGGVGSRNRDAGRGSAEQRQAALALQLIERYGVVTRECVAREQIPGGFSGLYPVFKALEEAGRLRRGYFVAGLGAAQFAIPGADERLRNQRGDVEQTPPTDAVGRVLSAVDPANPYGAMIDWPPVLCDAARPQRAAGSRVVIRSGRLLGWLNATGESLTTFFNGGTEPPSQLFEPAQALARSLAAIAGYRSPLVLKRIDNVPALESAQRPAFESAGFTASGDALICRRNDPI